MHEPGEPINENGPCVTNILKFYEDIKKDKNKFKEDLKIRIDHSKQSNVWKYCGALFFKDKHIFSKRIFCNLCLEQDE